MNRAAVRRRVNRALDRALVRAEEDARRRAPRFKAPGVGKPKGVRRVG